MKVLGIDPGTAACGYGIVQEDHGRLAAVDFGWWHTSSGERLELRLKTVFEGVRDLIDQLTSPVTRQEPFFAPTPRGSQLFPVERSMTCQRTLTAPPSPWQATHHSAATRNALTRPTVARARRFDCLSIG